MVSEKIKAPKAAKKVAATAPSIAPTMDAVVQNTVKKDYGRDNLFTVMLQCLFMATGAPSPFQAFAELQFAAFRASEFFTEFAALLSNPPSGVPYLETIDGKLTLTAAGRKRATLALKASFEEQKKGINASQVVADSSTNYLLAVGGEIFGGGITRMLANASDNFVATPQLRAGMMPLVSKVVRFAELLGITDDVLQATLNCELVSLSQDDAEVATGVVNAPSAA